MILSETSYKCLASLFMLSGIRKVSLFVDKYNNMRTKIYLEVFDSDIDNDGRFNGNLITFVFTIEDILEEFKSMTKIIEFLDSLKLDIDDKFASKEKNLDNDQWFAKINEREKKV